MAVVYRHLRKDNLEPFYIGIGKDEKRAYSFGKYKRSKFWTRYFNKYGCIVEIVAKDLLWEDACEMEKLLIALYGRIDNGTGTLVNMTDGGDGRLGSIQSEETRLKISSSCIGRIDSDEVKEKRKKSCLGKLNGRKHTPEHNAKIGLAGTGRIQSPETIAKRVQSNSGYRHSDETKEKLRLARLGKKNSQEAIEKTIATKLRNKQLRKCQNQSEIT